MSPKMIGGKEKRIEVRYLIFLLAVSTVLMTFGSMTSFLFPMHVGVDQNVFYTLGKSILDGKVMYKDIYDQKGPLLFFMHTFAAMISGKNFLGIYLLQILNFTFILYYTGKISELYLDKKYRSLVAAACGLIIVTAFCYSRGDNAEEFCMGFYMIGMYHLLRYFKNPEKGVSNGVMIANGIFASCILWIKFTLLGFYIGWCLVIGLSIMKRKDFMSAVKAALLFLLGIVIGTIPYLIYFIATDAMYDFYWGYFYTNVCMYSAKVTLLRRIQVFFTEDILWNPVMMPVILFGLGYFVYSKEELDSKEQKAGLVFIAICSYVFVFIGGTRYKYYLQIIGAFTVFGAIAIVKLMQGILAKWMQHKRRTLSIAVAAYLAILIVFSNCAPYYFKPADYYPQVRISKIIKENHGTVLNYNFLDAGIYLMSGSKLPDTKFFVRQNFIRSEFPELLEEPEEIIKNKGVDYVVMRYGRGKDLDYYIETPYLLENYSEVVKYYEPIDDYHFVLFQVKK